MQPLDTRERERATAIGAWQPVRGSEMHIVDGAPLGPQELQRIDAYWRAANYLSVGQIYLMGNPLLREPLAPEQVKPRLAGLCGDNDMRTVQSRAEAGDTAARQALQVYCYRIRKYIGAYHAVLGRLDAIVFTAGVGEHSPLVRSEALACLQPMGIAVDEDRNHTGPSARVISPRESRVAVCVVPTDEEHAIAEETAELLNVSGATSDGNRAGRR